MKKIVHIIQCLSGGGAARELVYLAGYSNKTMEYQHQIVTLHPSADKGLQLADAYHVPVLETPTTTHLHAQIDSADILQVHWWNNPEISNFLHTQLPKTRLVIRYHVAGEETPHKILPQHFKMADVNITSFDKLSLPADFCEEWRKERIHWILHGTDFNRLKEINLKKHHGFNVGFIGTISYVKMHPDFLRMSTGIDIPHAKFIICGDVEEPELVRFAQTQNQSGRFDFRGYVEDIASVISEMDVFGYPLCPHTYASTDLVLQEVMYAGIPAVVFPYGGVTQTVKDGFNGIVVQNTDEYKKAIEYLHKNPEERARMGDNAKKHIRRHFGIQNKMKQYHSIYKKLLQRPKTWHEWGKDAHIPLMEQSLTLGDITGISPLLSTAELFSESLGEHGCLFKANMSRELSTEDLFKSDSKIAEVSNLVYRGGITWYQNFDPDDAYLNFWAGLNALKRGSGEQAILFFITANKNGFSHWRLYYYLATALKTTGKVEDAQTILHTLSQIKPGYKKEVARFGKENSLLFAKHNYSEKHSSEITIDEMQQKAEALAQAGKDANAIQILLQLLSYQADHAIAHNDLGVLYYKSGEKEKALQCYQKAVELEPENIIFQKNLADFYYVEMGQVEEAMQLYVKVLNANPEDVETLHVLAHICVALEKFDDAKTFYNRILKIEPNNTDASEFFEKHEKYQLSVVGSQADQKNHKADSNGYLVSAIVSTYNAERFIRGCLEDLENQTIADRLEIIVVNSCSQQNEETVIREFQKKFLNIKYIKTDQRETVYAAWNRGIQAATGKYITNANTDDRHRKDALEVMVNILETLPEISLVYSDVIITETENETFQHCTPVGFYRWMNFNRDDLLNRGCFVGPQPMWRRQVHNEYGYFDESFVTSGDYEFWLRISQTCTFLHLPALLGLYLKSPNSIEHANRNRQAEENRRILQMYSSAKSSGKFIRRQQTPKNSSAVDNHWSKAAESKYHDAQELIQAEKYDAAIENLIELTTQFPLFAPAYNDLGILYHGRDKLQAALEAYKKAVKIEPSNIIFQKNLADFYCVTLGKIETAMDIYVDVLRQDPSDSEALLAMGHICRMLERFEDADSFYRRVLETDSDNQIARNYLRNGKQGAVNTETSPTDESAYHELSQTMANDSLETAIKKIMAFLAAFPDFAPAHNDLATLCQQSGDIDRAQIHYEKAASLQMDNAEFQKGLADFYFVELGHKSQALKIYRELLEKNPDNATLLLMAGHICVTLKQINDAEVFYRRLLSSDPANPDARTYLEHIERLRKTQSNDAKLPLADLQEARGPKHQKAAEPMSDPTPATASVRQQEISILLPTEGPAKQLRRCVQAIERQTPEAHEIVFIDSGMTKGCAKWLRTFLGKNDHCHKVRCKPDSNMAGVFNAGIAASRGEVIVCLSNDVEVTPGWLSAMLGHWERSAGAGLVGAMSNTAESCQKVPAPWNRADTMLSDFGEDYRQRNRGRRIPSDTVDGFCMLMHRKLIEKIGHFDEQVGQGGYEAEDLCLRASLAGYQNLIAGDVYLHRRVGKTASRSQKTFNLKWSGADGNSPEGKRHLALLMVEKARRAWQAEHIEEAGERFLQVIGLLPEWPNSYYQLARMLIQTNQFQEALDVLSQLPGERPDAGALVLAASCEEGLGNHEKAQQLADQAQNIEPNNAPVLNIQGLLAYRKADRQTAAKYFERAIATDPGFAEAHTNLGVLKWEAGEKQAAIDLYERGFIVDPSDYEIAAAYHGAISELNAYKRAEPIIGDAAGACPYSKKIRYMRIDCLLHLKAYPQAMAEIEGAMADFGVDDGILDSALKIREILGPLSPKDTQAANPSVSLCMIIKNEREYLPSCLKSVKPVIDEMLVIDTGSDDDSPDIARAFGAKVSTCNWKGDFSEARNHSLAQASGDVVFLMDADEAISPIDYGLFRRLVRRSSREKLAFIITTRNYSMDNNLVHWVANEGHYGSLEAGTGWTPSPKIRIFPRDDSIHFSFPVHEMVEPSLENAGVVMKPCNLQVHHYGKLNRQKSDQKGEMYYEIGLRKLQETGDAPVALRELAIQAESLKKHEESIDLWMRYIALVPNDPKAYINMGVSYCNLGRFDEVLATAKRVLRFAPDSKEGHYNYALAKLHLGQPQQAVGTLEKLFQSMPEYLPARFLLAAAKCTIGDRQTGITMLEELSRTVIGPGLAIRCHELAKGLVANHKTAYALALLDAAIDSKNSNQEVLELYTDCLEMSDISRKTGTYE